MTHSATSWASYAFMERNFFLSRRTWAWEVAFLVYSVASALSISLIGVDQGSAGWSCR